MFRFIVFAVLLCVVLAQAQPGQKNALSDDHDPKHARLVATFDTIPDVIVSSIIDLLDLQSAAEMAATSKSMMKICDPVVTFKALCHPALPESQLDLRIRTFVRQDEYLDQLTPEQCLVVYDRLVKSRLPNDTKLKLIQTLIDSVKGFSDIAWSLPMSRSSITVHPNGSETYFSWPVSNPRSIREPFIQQLLELPIPAVSPGTSIPSSVIKSVGAAISRYQVWADWPQHPISGQFVRRFPAPFNQIWALHSPIEDRVLFDPENSEFLSTRDGLLELAKFGMRFDLPNFLAKVPIPVESLPELYPFLRKHDFLDLLKRIDIVPLQYHEQLMQIPHFFAFIKSNPYHTALYLFKMQQHLDKVEMKNVINMLKIDNHVMNAAIVAFNGGLTEFLLGLRMFNMYVEAPVPNENRPDIRVRSPLGLILEKLGRHFVADCEIFMNLVRNNMQKFVDYCCDDIEQGNGTLYGFITWIPELRQI